MNGSPSLFDGSEDIRDRWLQEAKRVARDLGVNHEVTADDIHERCPIPPGVDGRIMGTVFRGMRLVGRRPSRRSINHNRTIAIFRTL